MKTKHLAKLRVFNFHAFFNQFAVALVAFFAVAQGSAILPYAAWPYAQSYLAAPAISQIASAPAHLPISWSHQVSAVHPALVAAPHSVQIASHYAAPAAFHYAPAIHVAPAVLPVAKHAATYTAATLGAVHTAPLEGHAISRTNLNLAPAPGTL